MSPHDHELARPDRPWSGRSLAQVGAALARRAGASALDRIGLQPADRRPTMPAALAQLQRAGIDPRTVFDVGAAYGRWSVSCAAVFPRARYVMVEPLSEFAPFLAAAATTLTGSIVVPAAVADAPGRRVVNVHADLVGSSLYEEGAAVRTTPRHVDVTAIDTLIREHSLEGPFLIKIDVQGAELDVLRGAAGALHDASALVVETALLPFFSGGSRFADVVAFLAARGLVVYDVVDPVYRPLDGALAQVDLVFVAEDGIARADRAFADAETRAALDRHFRLAYRLRRLRLRRRAP